ncbi:hypothetical protein AVEN_102736-1 [Araneus ventricosus]|uniref:Uncharacterized protein n=1 Tax=Araneus ventricosus TaxID=182803 RepID=A0A4Y2NXY1_ARAVE|nr:hypothetical protein AVEN_255831-1 [Araneus ventricosus]GBN42606.1 hypothetical protein AVEN_102736-1 [Araneus ventricosus]
MKSVDYANTSDRLYKYCTRVKSLLQLDNRFETRFHRRSFEGLVRIVSWVKCPPLVWHGSLVSEISSQVSSSYPKSRDRKRCPSGKMSSSGSEGSWFGTRFH